MFIYRFKLSFEDQDDFAREVEIRADQTFFEFYHTLKENLALNESLGSSFFLCDHRFRKKKEIAQPHLRTHSNDTQEEVNPKLFMDQCVLSDYVDDPHQKFLFIYDLSKDWSFFIELAKIATAQKNGQYPRIISSKGGIPREISNQKIPDPGIQDYEEEDNDLEEQSLEAYEDNGPEGEEDFDDSAFYSNLAHSSEDDNE